MFAVFLSFLLGVLFAVVAQTIFLLSPFDRPKKRSDDSREPDDQLDVDRQQPRCHAHNKKGIVWVLASEKVQKAFSNVSSTKVTTEQNNEELMEVYPVKKYAKIQDRFLILFDDGDDGSGAFIELSGCTIISVSASDLYPRKWSKWYPIKLENKSSEIYKGSKICYLYLDTSRKKESWYKALCLASCPDKENQYINLSDEFGRYLKSVNAAYLSFPTPSALPDDTYTPYITNNVKKPSSKVRRFLKKVSKKVPKNGVENKISSQSSSTRKEGKFIDNLPVINDSVKSSPVNPSSGCLTDLVQPASPSTTYSDNKNLLHVLPNAVQDNKYLSDEGTLCWTLLVWRLFFDAKKSPEINNIIKEHIQRALLDMRDSHYIDELTCTRLDLGDLPPCIHNIKVLSLDMKEAWEVEVDIEYSGGLILDIQTRARLCNPEMEESIESTNLGPSSGAEVTSDLHEACGNYGKKLNLSDDSGDGMENKDEDSKPDRLKQSKGTSWGPWGSACLSKLKAKKSSIAEPVSQVPAILAIKVALLRGTLQLRMMPPPSDQLWFEFTSMPEIDLRLESDSVDGERKVTDRIALVIINQLKDAIRENLVHPNSECICIPWMLGGKDDWVQRKDAPYIWADTTLLHAQKPLTENSKSQSDWSATLDKNIDVIKDVLPDLTPQTGALALVSLNQSPERNTSKIDRAEGSSLDQSPERNTSKIDGAEGGSSNQSPERNTSKIDGAEGNSSNQSPEMSTPKIDEAEGTCNQRIQETAEISLGAMVMWEELAGVKPKKSGRKLRMMDIGKKMGEKLEQKRRHIEEKGRHMVGKIRDTNKNDS